MQWINNLSINIIIIMWEDLFDWYLINEKGEIFSKYINKKLSLNKHNDGYLQVWLSINKKRKSFLVHRLVAKAFLWLDINSKLCVCHKDDNPSNNHKDNLFIWTHQDNMTDRDNKWRLVNNMTWKFWKLHPRAKKIKQYTLSWGFIKAWNCISDAERVLKIYSWGITKVCKWQHKHCWGFRWKYN